MFFQYIFDAIMMYTWSRPFQTHSTFPAYETSFNRINSRCVDEMCTVRSNYSHSFLMTEFFIHSQTFIAGTKWKIRCRSSACICHLNTNMNRKFIFKLELKFKNLIKKGIIWIHIQATIRLCVRFVWLCLCIYAILFFFSWATIRVRSSFSIIDGNYHLFWEF